jgi:hypothetical protein
MGKLKNIPKSETHRKNISKSLTGLTKSELHVNKINKNPEKIRKTAEAHRGMKRTEESKEKMRKAKIGYVPWNKGKRGIYSEETLQKMRDSKLNPLKC